MKMGLDRATIVAHPFFRAIRERFPSVYASLLLHDWILAVPVASSLSSLFSRTDLRSVFTEEFVASHVLRPSPPSSEYDFITLNNRGILASDGGLSTSSGFVGRRDCRVLLDEMIDDPSSGSSLIVYLIEQPLIPRADELQDESTRHAAESVLSLPNILAELKDVGTRAMSHLESLMNSFNDKVARCSDLETLHQEMHDYLVAGAQIIHQMDKRATNTVLTSFGLTHEMLFQILETYLMENSYEIVYYQISKELLLPDQEMSEASTSIKYLDLYQLGLPYTFGPSLLKAAKEFGNIASLRTPFEKIKCLMRSIRMLRSTEQGSDSEIILSSDVLVPLLVLMVVRSNAQNLRSSLFYMQKFTFEHDVISGEYGYALSTLEGVISYILDASATLSATSAKNKTIMDACRSADLQTLSQYFLTSAIDSDDTENDPLAVRSWDGDDLLLLAVSANQASVVEFLLSQGADLSSANYLGHSAIHVCSKFNLVELGANLLSRGATYETRDSEGMTPFLLAASCGNWDFCKLLASPPYSCDVNAQSRNGFSAYHFAKPPLVEILQPLGADTDLMNEQGLTPLLHHCQLGDVAMIGELVKAGADLNAEDLGHRTCLHICCFRGYVDTVKLILAAESPKKADVGALSLRGNSPLHAAAEPGHVEIVKLLLDAGANSTIRNMSGLTASDVANDETVKEVIENYSLLHSTSTVKLTPPTMQYLVEATRIMIVQESLVVTVKSGQRNDFSGVISVRRSLQDFAFLDKMFRQEHAEICLPEIDEITSGKLVDPTKASSQKHFKKVQNRLSQYLKYIAQHPILAKDPVFTSFLRESILKYGELSDIIRESVAIRLETLSEDFPPFVESLEECEVLFDRAEETLRHIKDGIHKVVDSAVRSARASRESSAGMRVLSFCLSRPTANLVFTTQLDRRKRVGNGLRRISDIARKKARVHSTSLWILTGAAEPW
ncbi:ankyrin repeat-containing domain protein [Zopfochytrium polystomum]|nr:ankyrin repeat-containing domain protein [Zopfochytrium polystomum]